MTTNQSMAISSIFDEFEQIKNLITKRGNRSLTETQLKIMVNTRLTGLTDAINKFENVEMPVQTKAEVYQELLQKIAQLLGHKPQEEPSLYWYKLEVTRCNMIVSLFNVWGKGGLLRVIGTANALANILLGLEEIKIPTLLVGPNHPEFRVRNILAANLAYFRVGVFAGAATIIYSIPQERIEEWTIKALEGIPDILTMIEKNWDIPTQLEIDRKLGGNRTTNNCGVKIEILNEVLGRLIQFQARFNDRWPKIPQKVVEMIDPSTTESYLGSLYQLYKKQQEYIQDLEQHHQKGTFGPNVNPYEEPVIQRALTISILTNLNLKGIELIHKYKQKREKKAFEELKKMLEEITTRFDRILDTLNSPQFLNSTNAENLAKPLYYFIYFAGIVAVDEQETTALDKLEALLNESYFSKEGIEHFPYLKLLYLTAKLTTALNKNDQKMSLETAKKLLQLEPLLKFQPRDAFAAYLQGELTKLAYKKIKPETFKKRMKKKLMEMKEYLGKTLGTEIEEYLAKIETISRKGGEQKENKKNERKTKQNPFDPYSMIVPDLTTPAEQNDQGKLFYLPFNLGTDYIVKKNKN
ncbi:MAG: hypothetical protein GF308_20540 [Candidatus Heimdallarchaeota archaeon]|nr:hypothetical protein [Candidatus Heimdallarchaeota archaeon]